MYMLHVFEDELNFSLLKMIYLSNENWCTSKMINFAFLQKCGKIFSKMCTWMVTREGQLSERLAFAKLL